VDPEQEFADYQGTIEKALSCPILGERIKVFQQKYFGFDQREQYAVMTETICDILNEK
jgi:hypothetical protein